MPFNPCGWGVDWLREATEDFIRPFRDSPIVVKRRWFPVPEGTPILPFPTAFLSSRWEPFPWLPRTVGDVFPPKPAYRKPEVLGGFTYTHYCGTPDQFARGAELDPDFVQEYDDDWIPLCCKRVAVCVFHLCWLGTINSYPASQLTTYPVAQQTATPTTPVLNQFVFVNGEDTDPPLAIAQTTFQPGGADNPNGFTEQLIGGSDGQGVTRLSTVRFDPLTATTARQSYNQFTLDFEFDEDTAQFVIFTEDGTAILSGTNLTIDPALLPPPPPPASPWSSGSGASAGTSRVTATPISATMFRATANATGEGFVMPASAPGIWVISVLGSSPAFSCKLYPALGEAFEGKAVNVALDIVAGNVYLLVGQSGHSGDWAYATI